jgi:hypothetical protein
MQNIEKEEQIGLFGYLIGIPISCPLPFPSSACPNDATKTFHCHCPAMVAARRCGPKIQHRRRKFVPRDEKICGCWSHLSPACPPWHAEGEKEKTIKMEATLRRKKRTTRSLSLPWRKPKQPTAIIKRATIDSSVHRIMRVSSQTVAF